jgi:cyanophycin synthetase
MTIAWDASESGLQPGFLYSTRWSALRGIGYGQREPVLTGAVRIVLPRGFELALLDRAVARVIPEPLPEDLGGETDEEKLARRVVFWSGALQRGDYVPVFGRGDVGRPRRTEDGGVAVRLVVPFFAPQATQAALDWIGKTVHTYLATGRFGGSSAEEAQKNWTAARATISAHRLPGVNPYRLLKAASTLDVPARQFLPGYLSVGHGARTRWLESSYTDRTGLISARLANDKMATATILRRAGLPAPTHVQVRSAEEAVKAAHELGYPVVVKPADGEQGRGVAADLGSDSLVAAAYANAARISRRILVEKHFQGSDYRMNVLDGQLLGVVERVAGGVIGDGKSSVAALVESLKLDDRRARRARERQRELLELDEEALQLLRESGLTPQSVPEDGAYVRLRRRANSSAGGSQRQVKLETVHPDNLRLPVLAAEALRLDLAGVDILFPDIRKSWRQTGALICEINGQPQIGTTSSARLLTALLGGDGRIPIVVVVGCNTGVDWSAIRPALPFPDKAGLASPDGIWLGDERITVPRSNAFGAAQRLLNHPEAESALVILTPGEIRRFGLPMDLCDALILDAPDNWPTEDKEGLEEILDIAGRNARQTIHTPPGAELGRSGRAKISVVERRESLEEICTDILRRGPWRASAEPRRKIGEVVLEAH